MSRVLRGAMAVASLSAIGVVGALGACRARPAPVVEVARVQTEHRERARAILEQHCGLCHLPGSSDGLVNPDAGFRVAGGIATHIFDLRSEDWSGTLSDAQLDQAIHMLADGGADADEMRTFEEFVADEVTWRDAHAAEYPRALRDRPL